MKFPKIKKRLSSYLMGEEGKISKQSLLNIGALLGAASLGTILMGQEASAEAAHSNSLTLNYNQEGVATATHSHHSSY